MKRYIVAKTGDPRFESAAAESKAKAQELSPLFKAFFADMGLKIGKVSLKMTDGPIYSVRCRIDVNTQEGLNDNGWDNYLKLCDLLGQEPEHLGTMSSGMLQNFAYRSEKMICKSLEEYLTDATGENCITGSCERRGFGGMFCHFVIYARFGNQGY